MQSPSISSLVGANFDTYPLHYQSISTSVLSQDAMRRINPTASLPTNWEKQISKLIIIILKKEEDPPVTMVRRGVTDDVREKGKIWGN